MDEWINKICYVHISSHKKEENLAICNMDGAWGPYAKWTKSDRERKIPFNLIYMCIIKKKKKKQKNEFRDAKNSLVVSRGSMWSKWDGWR